MTSYHLAWAVFLTYDHKKEILILEISDTFKDKYHLDQKTMMLEERDIKSFIHKYDYKKFEYFSMQQLKTFDTELKFRFDAHKPYIKTQAICQKTHHGFECVLIEEKVLFETKRSLSKVYQHDMDIEFLEKQDVKDHMKEGSLSKMKHQLHTFFERRMI
jgi:hypothetical protein